MLHFIAPLNILLDKHLLYRITDFHPECLIVGGGWRGPLAEMTLRLTRFWCRRIDEFEVLGIDQVRRLVAMGISEDKIRSPEGYCRVDVGDVEGLVKKLQALERAVVAERKIRRFPESAACQVTRQDETDWKHGPSTADVVA